MAAALPNLSPHTNRTCGTATAWAARWGGACGCWGAAPAASTRRCTCRQAQRPVCAAQCLWLLLGVRFGGLRVGCYLLLVRLQTNGGRHALLLILNNLCLPLSPLPQVSGVSDSARAAIEKAGGSVTTVYYNQLGGCWPVRAGCLGLCM